MADVQHEGAAADRGAVHPGRLDAEIVADLLRRFDGGGETIDVGQLQPGIGNGIERRIRVKLELRDVGDDTEFGGLGRADDGNLIAAHALSLRRTEYGEGDLVVERLEGDLELHVEFERLRRLRAVDDVAHPPRSLFELDYRNRVRRREAGRGGTVVDHVAVEKAVAARLEDADLARGAGRAERAWREIDTRAGVAALQAQLARLGAVPEMLGLRRRFRSRALRFGHLGRSSQGQA